MSFNQKSGKTKEKRSTSKQNRIDIHRKPVVLSEAKQDPKSQRQTNIQSNMHDDYSIKDDSRFILPSIIQKRPNIQQKQSPSRSYFRGIYSTEQKTNKQEDDQQNLFTVNQNQKFTKFQKRSIIKPWYKKLRKKEQDIILNYLSMKVETQRVKKGKRKLKKSISNQKMLEENKISSKSKDKLLKHGHRRNQTDLKPVKISTIKLDETIINRRQSLPNYTRLQNCSPEPFQINKVKKPRKIRLESRKLNDSISEIQENNKLPKQQKQQDKIPEKGFSFRSGLNSHIKLRRPEFLLRRKSEMNDSRQEIEVSKVSQQSFKKNQKQHSQDQEQINSKKQQQSEQDGITQGIHFKEQENHKINRLNQEKNEQKLQMKVQTDTINQQRQKQQEQNKAKNDLCNSEQNQGKNSLKISRLYIQQEQKNSKKETINLKDWTESQSINIHSTIENQQQAHQNQKVQIDKEEKIENIQQKQLNNKKEQKGTNQFNTFNGQPENQLNQDHALSNKKPSPKEFLTQLPDKSFLNIKTYYAEVDKLAKTQKIQKIQNHTVIENQTLSVFIMNLPTSDQIVLFIENYTPQNEEICLQELMKHQKFTIIFKENQQLYFGLIENQNKSGFGITIKKNYLFEGQYSEGNKIQGVQINQVGKYIGNFRNHKRQGYGTFYWKNGQKYSGQWSNGKKHGKGIWQSPNGDIYDGQWVQGKVQGYGIHKSSNGQQYEGFFHEFLKHGRGLEILPNGDQYEGQFWKGKPHGKGKYCWKQGSIYEGIFFKGFRQGFGVLKDQQGNIYKGDFKSQQASGNCELAFSNQNIYKGSINKGYFDGQGVYKIQSQQRQFSGQWVLDEFVGSFSSEQN